MRVRLTVAMQQVSYPAVTNCCATRQDVQRLLRDEALDRDWRRTSGHHTQGCREERSTAETASWLARRLSVAGEALAACPLVASVLAVLNYYVRAEYDTHSCNTRSFGRDGN